MSKKIHIGKKNKIGSQINTANENEKILEKFENSGFAIKVYICIKYIIKINTSFLAKTSTS